MKVLFFYSLIIKGHLLPVRWSVDSLNIWDFRHRFSNQIETNVQEKSQWLIFFKIKWTCLIFPYINDFIDASKDMYLTLKMK